MKVKFAHVRPVKPRLVVTNNAHVVVEDIAAKGGRTIAYVLDDDYRVIGYAVARCSRKDFYNKRTGRELAQERLKDEKFYIEVPAIDEDMFLDGAHASV